MRKIFMVGASVAASVLLMTGCNKQVIDLTYEYSQAQIKMPDGTVIEGKVDSWNDYEGDQLQVKINGTTYAVRTIAKEIVKTGIKEKQIWYNEAAIQTELENAEVGRLVRCWLKNVWPLPQLRSLQSRLSHLR